MTLPPGATVTTCVPIGPLPPAPQLDPTEAVHVQLTVAIPPARLVVGPVSETEVEIAALGPLLLTTIE